MRRRFWRGDREKGAAGLKERHSAETYIEAIYVLSVEGGALIAARLAEYLNLSRPSVTQMLKRLVADGDVEIEADRAIRLTKRGLERAHAIVRRHRILERWLTDVLGLDWGTAHLEASRLERAISPLVEKRLEEFLGFPKTCPHGNAIPGNAAAPEPATPLSAVAGPQTVRVVRIFEQVEEDADLLRYLQETGFVPGHELAVLPQDRYADGFTIDIGGKRVSLSKDLAERILVHPVAVLTGAR